MATLRFGGGGAGVHASVAMGGQWTAWLLQEMSSFGRTERERGQKLPRENF
jgi:hypothetical protein